MWFNETSQMVNCYNDQFKYYFITWPLGADSCLMSCVCIELNAAAVKPNKNTYPLYRNSKTIVTVSVTPEKCQINIAWKQCTYSLCATILIHTNYSFIKYLSYILFCAANINFRPFSAIFICVYRVQLIQVCTGTQEDVLWSHGYVYELLGSCLNIFWNYYERDSTWPHPSGWHRQTGVSSKNGVRLEDSLHT